MAIEIIQISINAAGKKIADTIAQASEKYVYLMHDDERYEEEFLQNAEAFADDYRADILLMDYYRENKSGDAKQITGINRELFPHNKATFSYKNTPHIFTIAGHVTCARVYRTEFVKEMLEVYPQLADAGESVFNALMGAVAGRIAYMQTAYVYSRERTGAFKKQNIFEECANLMKTAKLLGNYAEIESALGYFVSEKLIDATGILNYGAASGKYRSAYSKLRKFFRQHNVRISNKKSVIRDDVYRRFKEIQGRSYAKLCLVRAVKKVFRPLTKRISKISEEQKKMKNQLKDLSTIQKEVTRLKKDVEGLQAVLAMQTKGTADVERSPRIILSMTSYPARIPYIGKSLDSLMLQTLKPDKIVLWLSQDQFPGREDDLPAYILEMRDRGLEVEWCEGDIKAYKKLLPALEKYPDDIVITFDDDLVYDHDLVENLYKEHILNPAAIIAARAHQVALDEEGRVLPYQEWIKEISARTYEIPGQMFLTGGAGTLFPPGCFTEEVLNYEVINKLCPYADDIWLNVMARLNNTEIINTAINRRLRYVDDTQEQRLYEINIVRNDKQMNDLLKHYHGQLDGAFTKFNNY